MADIYKHYKGGKYKLVGIAKHSETLEEMVIYKALYDNSVWVRPKKMFFENVVVDGKEMPRFELISE